MIGDCFTIEVGRHLDVFIINAVCLLYTKMKMESVSPVRAQYAC